MRAAQAYALANGLGIQDGMPAASGASGSSSGGSVEASREEAQNQVNALRQRIAQPNRQATALCTKRLNCRPTPSNTASSN